MPFLGGACGGKSLSLTDSLDWGSFLSSCSLRARSPSVQQSGSTVTGRASALPEQLRLFRFPGACHTGAMFKATAKLYDPKQKVLAEHTALGSTVILASEAAIKKLLDEVGPGWLRLIEKSITLELLMATGKPLMPSGNIDDFEGKVYRLVLQPTSEDRGLRRSRRRGCRHGLRAAGLLLHPRHHGLDRTPLQPASP